MPSKLALALTAALAFTAPSRARADVEGAVTCGSALKIKHANTKHVLASQPVAYASGSGQQSVTAIKNAGEEAYWLIHGAVGEDCARGAPVTHGMTVRFRHAGTRAWLHSHEHRSPLSGNNEVSCFGGDESSDTGDNWIVEVPSGGGTWEMGKKVRFKHVDTGAYLQSHGLKYGRPIAGHQEVMAQKSAGPNALWTTEGTGVFFPTAQEIAAKDEL
jgi:dolichyl-phosphate-mannose--protein O-mannosyl transferase